MITPIMPINLITLCLLLSLLSHYAYDSHYYDHIMPIIIIDENRRHRHHDYDYDYDYGHGSDYDYDHCDCDCDCDYDYDYR